MNRYARGFAISVVSAVAAVVLTGVFGLPTHAALVDRGARASVSTFATSCRAVNLTSGAGPTDNLQRLIDRADWGDQIRVRGVCKGNFAVHRDLTLVGKATRAWPAPTLDGNADVCDRPCFVLRVTDLVEGRPIPDLTVRDLTITGGEKASGAGILKKAGTLTLRGGTNVTGNVARRSGGGIYSQVGKVILRGHAAVSGNRAGRYRGGGIWATDGNVVLQGHAKVTGNVAHYSGGGVEGSVIMSNHAAVLDNLVERIGGGGGISGNRVAMRDNTRVCRNTVKHDADVGGGVRSGELRMRDDAKVCKNVALAPSSQGGGVASIDIVLADRATVTGNSAGGEGGGIWSREGSMLIRNEATVTGNSAVRGGGIYSRAPVTVTDSATVSGNSANKGGGVYNLGALTVSGQALVADNSAALGGAVYTDGYTTVAPPTTEIREEATVIGNAATSDGGGIYAIHESTVILTGGSAVTSNLAGNNGGGVYIAAPVDTETEEPSSLMMLGSALISLNTAGSDGGGVFNDHGVLTITELAAVTENTPNDVVSLP